MNNSRNETQGQAVSNQDIYMAQNGFRDTALLERSMEITDEAVEETTYDDISNFNLEWNACQKWRTKYWNKTGAQANELRNMGKENEFTHIIAKDCGVEDGAKHFFMSKKPHGDFVNYLFSRPATERFYYEVLALENARWAIMKAPSIPESFSSRGDAINVSIASGDASSGR